MMTFPIYGKIKNVPNHHPDNTHPINYSSSMGMSPAARSRADCRYCAAGFQLCHPRPPADERGVFSTVFGWENPGKIWEKPGKIW